MAAPELTYEIYSAADGWRGKLEEDAFLDALPRARARLVAVTGDAFDARQWGKKWLYALCALVDVEAGASEHTPGIVSESVGATSTTYADWVIQATDVDLVAPYLAGTPLLYQGIG